MPQPHDLLKKPAPSCWLRPLETETSLHCTCPASPVGSPASFGTMLPHSPFQLCSLPSRAFFTPSTCLLNGFFMPPSHILYAFYMPSSCLHHTYMPSACLLHASITPSTCLRVSTTPSTCLLYASAPSTCLWAWSRPCEGSGEREGTTERCPLGPCSFSFLSPQ